MSLILPQEILLHLFPDNSFENQSSNIGNNGDPMLFEIINYNVADDITIPVDNHPIVSLDSFLDIDGIYVTDKIFRELNVEIYTSVMIKLCKKSYPKGEKIVLEPQNKEFLLVKNQETLLLPTINKDFRILNINQEFSIFSTDLNQDLTFKLIDMEPKVDIISTTDIDLIVDFKIPEEFIPKSNTNNQDTSIKDSSKKSNFVSINSSIFNFDSNEKSKDSSFPGVSHTLNNSSNNSSNTKDLEETPKVLSKEELRLARLKAFTKK